jgi:predicted DsbA family dithiol-disulfide isomerase
MKTLLFYHDFNSPFCRVGLAAALEVARDAGLALDPVPIELFPAPVPLPSLQVLAADVEQALPLAREQGISLTVPSILGRTRKAHEAVSYARSAGLGLEMLEALYDVVWQRGLDVGRLDRLSEVASGVGVEPGGLLVALGLDALEPEIQRADRRALQASIVDIPAFQVGGDVLIGAVTAPNLGAWIRART